MENSIPFKTPVRLEPHGADSCGPIYALVTDDQELICVLDSATPDEAHAIMRLINQASLQQENKS